MVRMPCAPTRSMASSTACGKVGAAAGVGGGPATLRRCKQGNLAL